MYDLANQSFQLLINTLLFSLFVSAVIVGDPDKGQRVWSYMVAGQLVLVILLSPVLGALADIRAWKREILLGTGVVCAAFTCLLSLLGPGQVWIAAAIYLVAALACGLGENFLGAFLPQISTPRTIGRVSAIGWTMSYVGALLLLGIAAAYIYGLNRSEPVQMRPMFLFSGLWFAAGMIPAVLYLRERERAPRGRIVGRGPFGRLLDSARHTREFSQLARFLGIFFIYTIGVQTVIFFLGLIGTSLGFPLKQLILFALVMAATAGVGAILTARYQDRFGHRNTILVFLAIWFVSTLAMALARDPGQANAVFWLISGGIGLALGGIGTASRATVGLFTPSHRAAEFFGLWGMATKLASITGALVFGQLGVDRGLFVLCGLFAIGFALMWLVDEREGARQALTSELPAEAGTGGVDSSA